MAEHNGSAGGNPQATAGAPARLTGAVRSAFASPPGAGPVTAAIRILVLALAVLGGLSLLGMTLITCLDVVLRVLGRPLVGAYDLVGALAVLTIGGALPYTTALKGHVSVEFFLHKLSRPWRRGVTAVADVLILALVAVLAWECVDYGIGLRQRGEVSPTLQMPLFWMPWAITASAGVTALVLVHGLLRPNRELVKP